VVEDGADSFLIQDGKIVAQTIHYTVTPAGTSGRRPQARRGRRSGTALAP
jgi:hypothetical protein